VTDVDSWTAPSRKAPACSTLSAGGGFKNEKICSARQSRHPRELEHWRCLYQMRLYAAKSTPIKCFGINCVRHFSPFSVSRDPHHAPQGAVHISWATTCHGGCKCVSSPVPERRLWTVPRHQAVILVLVRQQIFSVTGVEQRVFVVEFTTNMPEAAESHQQHKTRNNSYVYSFYSA